MPIEPTNVSKPAVREVEPASAKFGSWTSMQGSSSGGKDRPLNSLWEKAINGAQKLFGSDKSGSASLEEKGEQEEGRDAKVARTSQGELGIEAAPSFAGRRFGSFGGAAFGGNTFGSVATSRAAPETRGNDFDSHATFDTPKPKTGSDFTQKQRPVEKAQSPSAENAAQARAASDDRVEDEANAKEKRVEAGPSKSVQKSVATQPLVAATPAPMQGPAAPQTQSPVATPQEGQAPSAQPAATPAQSTPQGNVPQGKQPAQQPAASLATQQTAGKGNPNTNVANDSSKAQLPPQASAQAQATVANNLSPSKGGEGKVELPATPAQASQPSPVAKTEGETPKAPVPENAPKAEKPMVSAKPESPVAKPATDAATQAKDNLGVAKDASAAKESLGFDVSKAKEAVSEAFSKTASAKPGAQPTQASTSGNQPAAQAVTASVDSTPKAPVGEMSTTARLGETGSSEAKDLASADTSKRDVAATAQQRAANAKSASEGASQARLGAQEAVGSDGKLGQATTSAKATANQFAREAVAAAASRPQPTSGQGKGTAASATASNTTSTGVNGVSGGAPLANGVTAQGAQQGNSQNSDGDPAAKQDFGAAMKQAATSKGGEKPLDGGQSFEAKVEAAANRRSEAASKARQTSYVSKTAAEVKETVAALTKSIDRLVTDKTGAMNLKLNFEGGGSLNLKISMEGGKVATSMQTDVVGLEAAIKANWGELANDWNQKGVKLTTPLFQNSEAGKDSSFENLSEFASKQDRQSEGKAGDGRGRNAGQASNSRSFPDGTAEQGEANASGTEQKQQEIISDKELKTYA